MKRKAPDNKKSEKFTENNLKEVSNQTKQTFGIVQDLKNPVSRNAYSLVHNGAQISTASSYSAQVDRQTEVDKQNSLQQTQSFLSDITDTSRQEQYIRLSNEMDDFLTQHILFWIEVTNLLKEMEATTAQLAAK